MGGGGVQGGCEWRSEAFVKIKKKKIWGGGVGGSGQGGGWVEGGGGQGGCELRSEAFVKIKKKTKLELMFMKHYAPNRCLYIKVAKLRTGVGSAEMSHLQNCSLKIYLKRALGGGGGGGGGRLGGGVRMDVTEKLIFL